LKCAHDAPPPTRARTHAHTRTLTTCALRDPDPAPGAIPKPHGTITLETMLEVEYNSPALISGYAYLCQDVRAPGFIYK
jgi:hypothetical protein